MAQRTGSHSAMLNLRVDQEVKDRLLAAAFHVISASESGLSPDDVNLSEFLREEVLAPWLEEYESLAGGQRKLAEQFSSAKLGALEDSVAKLRGALLNG